jgi:uncharacterized protein (TIGR02246 family)
MYQSKARFLVLIPLSIVLTAFFTSTSIPSSSASPKNNTLMKPQELNLTQPSTENKTLNQSEEKKAIETVIKTYETAVNTNNIDTIMGLYGSEPVFMPQNSPALVGRDTVRAGYEQVFKTIKLNIRFEIHDIEIAGDWAWVRTSSAGRTQILANGNEVHEGNNELFVFHKEIGDWKIHRYLFSTNCPLA